MSTPEAPPTTLFTCKLPNGAIVGGSYDNASAVAIACAAFQSLQGLYPGGGHEIRVYDNASTVVAYVGYYAP